MDQLESQLQYFSRAPAIFKPVVSQSPSFMPEILWKAHIDFEVEEGERTIARAVYERLIAFRGHLKVWRSYALFEADIIPISRAEGKRIRRMRIRKPRWSLENQHLLGRCSREVTTI